MKLDPQDIKFAYMRLPKKLKKLMLDKEWHNKIFIGGGFIRAIIAGEKINDVDLFVTNPLDAKLIAYALADSKQDIYTTNNAITIRGHLPIQIITRWIFAKPEDVSNSFDFTICCAVIYYDGTAFDSYCDNRFYIDLASKRLRYRNPFRNEDAGGSMLRVLKYYQRGYRIPLDSLGNVIARLVSGVKINDPEKLDDQKYVGKIITGLLREVDPDIDPIHLAHLPNTEDIES
jgi:hypothetical protein